MPHHIQLLKQSFGISFLLNCIVKVLWVLAIDRQVQLMVSPQVYGQYYTLFQATLVGTVLLDFGIHNYFTVHFTNSTKAVRLLHYYKLLRIKLVLAALYIITCSIVAIVLHIQPYGLLLCILLVHCSNSLLLYIRTLLTSNQQYLADAYVSIADKALAIIYLSYYIYHSHTISIYLYVVVQLVSTCAIIIICFLYIRPKQTHNQVTITALPVRHFIHILPYTLLLLSMGILLRVHVLLLQYLSIQGSQQVAQYAFGFRLLDAFNTIGYMVAAYLFPYLCKHISNRLIVSKVVQQATALLLLSAICFVIITYISGPYITQLLYYTTEPVIVSIIQHMAIATLGCSLVHVYGTVLTASGGIKHFLYCTVVVAVCSISINYVVIPYYGALGASYVCAATQLCYGIVLYVYCVYHKLVMPYSLGTVFKGYSK